MADTDAKPATEHTKQKRGLGRGLNALFEDEEVPFPANPLIDDDIMANANVAGATGTQRRSVGTDQLEPGPFQPRHYFDHAALAELAESIAAHGVLQPILVREKPNAAGRFQIIAGERRWRAAQKAQLHEVPVIVKEFDDETALEIALIENLQREDLDALDEAQGYQRLMDEFGHTQEKLAAALGKSRSHVANMVRLLSLPDKVQIYVRQGKLTAGHARALITAKDPAALAEIVVAQGLNVRQTEKLATEQSDRPAKSSAARSKPQKDIDTLALEQEVSTALGMKVSIDAKTGGVGALKVEFKSLDQLDEVLHRLSHFPGSKQSG